MFFTSHSKDLVLKFHMAYICEERMSHLKRFSATEQVKMDELIWYQSFIHSTKFKHLKKLHPCFSTMSHICNTFMKKMDLIANIFSAKKQDVMSSAFIFFQK